MIERELSRIFGVYSGPSITRIEQVDLEGLPEIALSDSGVTYQTEHVRDLWMRRERLLREEVLKLQSPAALEALVRNLLREDRTEEAVAILREPSNEALQTPALDAARLQILCRTDPQAVEARLTEARAGAVLNTADPYLLLDLATALERLGKRQQAQNLCRRLRLESLEDPQPLGHLAELCWRIGDEHRVQEAIARALQRSRDDLRALNLQACLLLRQEKYPEALEALSHILSIDPLYRPALLNDLTLRRHYLGDQIDFDRIRTYLDTLSSDLEFAHRVCILLRENPGHSHFLQHIWRSTSRRFPAADETLRIGWLYCLTLIDSNKTAEASLVVADIAKKLSPETELACFEFAALGRFLGRPDSASVVRGVVGGDPGKRTWLQSALHGLDAYHAGNFDMASEEFENARRARPGEIAITRALLHSLLNAGTRYSVASQVGDQLLRIDRTDLRDWNNAIYADAMAGDTKRARTRWRTIERRPVLASLLSTKYYFRATYGLLLLRSGDIEGARREYVAAGDIAHSPELRGRVQQKWDLEMGRTFLQAGRPEEGRKLLAEAITGPDVTFHREAQQLLSHSEVTSNAPKTK